MSNEACFNRGPGIWDSTSKRRRPPKNRNKRKHRLQRKRALAWFTKVMKETPPGSFSYLETHVDG